MAIVFFCWGVIYGVVSAGIFLIQNMDEEDWTIKRKERVILFGCSGINSFLVCHVSRMEGVAAFMLSVLAGCLLFACITDGRACVVFQFTWWVAGAVGGGLLYRSYTTDCTALWTTDFPQEQRLLSLLFYIVLQEVIFCNAYGRADCHAFVVCALVGSAFGMNFLGYLIHMILAFSGLAITQAFRHNINQKGNLKQPVAFLPYITISFWALLYAVYSAQNGIITILNI